MITAYITYFAKICILHIFPPISAFGKLHIYAYADMRHIFSAYATAYFRLYFFLHFHLPLQYLR